MVYSAFHRFANSLLQGSAPARVSVLAAMLTGIAPQTVPGGSDPVPPGTGLAMRLLRTNCISCHNEEKRKGGLALVSRDAMMKGGDSGAVIVEGKPEDSGLIQSLSASADPHMPPKKQLSAAQIKVLEEWLRAGAPWDAAALAGEDAPLRPVALAALPAAYRPVMAIALSPDGTRLAAGFGNEVLLYEVSPGGLKFLARSSGHLDPVQSIAWTPDGKQLVTGAFRRVMVWTAAPLTPRREILHGLTDRIMALRMLPDGRQVLLADGAPGEKGVVRVLDTDTGQIIRSWTAHGDTVFAMALSADGKMLATAGGDKLVRFWDVAEGRETAKLEAHATQVLCLAFNSDGTQLVTGGADRQLKVWDVRTRENTVALAAKSTAFNAVAWDPAGPVFSVTDEGTLLRYTDMKAHSGAQSSETGSERQLAKAETSLFCLAASGISGRIFAGSSGGRILGWDMEGKLTDHIDPAAAPAVTTAPPK